MAQSDQAVEQEEQAVGQIIEEKTIAGGQLLGSALLNFPLPRSKFSPQTVKCEFTPPPGTKTSFIVLQRFNVMYTGEDYELQNLQIALRIQPTDTVMLAICNATLRDRNGGDGKPGREWEGSVVGLLLHFG